MMVRLDAAPQGAIRVRGKRGVYVQTDSEDNFPKIYMFNHLGPT